MKDKSTGNFLEGGEGVIVIILRLNTLLVFLVYQFISNLIYYLF